MRPKCPSRCRRPAPRTASARPARTLPSHPWAGAIVTMTLVARDEANNEGRSEPFELQLPERIFTKPVARALVEQRRILALDGDAQARVLTALDAMTIAPDKFKIESNVYLGLRSIFWQLARAKSDDSAARRRHPHVGHGGTARGRQRVRRRAGAAQCRGSPARGARTGRDRRGDQEAHRRAARGARQVHAGARRAGAAQSAAARASARPQLPPDAAAGPQEYDRPHGADGTLRRQGRRPSAPAGTAADARQPADGPARPAAAGRRSGRRHDAGARRARAT